MLIKYLLVILRYKTNTQNSVGSVCVDGKHTENKITGTNPFTVAKNNKMPVNKANKGNKRTFLKHSAEGGLT